MSFTRPGSDLAMTNQSANTGLYSFDWSGGDPLFDSTQAHRVLSLLVEHRPSPQKPGYWADTTGTRGSYLYTLRTITSGTPSQAEAFAADALTKAVNDNAITFDRARISARRVGQAGIVIKVPYQASGRSQAVALTVGQ